MTKFIRHTIPIGLGELCLIQKLEAMITEMRLLFAALACLIHLSVFGQRNTLDTENCAAKNHMTLKKVNPENNYGNRRQVKTICSQEDFMILLNPYNLPCSQILVDHFYCDICFDANENSITSYDGRKFYFENKLPAGITTECLSLISNMRMGSLEHSKFIQFENR